MRKVNFHTIDNLSTPPALIEKTLAIPSEKRTVNHKPLIAAAVILIVLGAAAIYGIFVAPAATVRLDSRESVTITLNSRGRVLSASDRPGLVGMTAEEAVGEITREMLDNKNLDQNENTLLIGYSEKLDADRLIARASGVFSESGFAGCVVALPSEDGGRNALIRCLGDTYGTQNLKGLTVNALALLLTDDDLRDEEISLTGSPSESAYIGFDGAVARAMSLTSFGENELADASVSYGVYHGRLIYLVRLNAGDKSEAYFINALTGAAEEALKAPADKINQAVEDALRTPSPDPPPQDATVKPTVAPPATAVPTEDDPADNPPVMIETEGATYAAPIQFPTTPESSEYTAVSIGLTELSFITLSLPEGKSPIIYQTLFEGHYIEPRSGEKQSGGTVAVITNLSQWRAFLSANSFSYTDRGGNTLSDGFTADYFTNYILIASACTVPDAGYYTTFTDISANGDTVYIENSLTYGTAPIDGTYCRTLSIYAAERSQISADMTFKIY